MDSSRNVAEIGNNAKNMDTCVSQSTFFWGGGVTLLTRNTQTQTTSGVARITERGTFTFSD